MSKMFFSQQILDALINEGKVTLEGTVLTVAAPNKPSFQLEPAFRFIRTADNGPDIHHLVGKIKPEKDLKASHAEIYMNSVLVQETAYEVELGFLGEKHELMDNLSDTDLLSRFLLENLL